MEETNEIDKKKITKIQTKDCHAWRSLLSRTLIHNSRHNGCTYLYCQAVDPIYIYGNIHVCHFTYRINDRNLFNLPEQAIHSKR